MKAVIACEKEATKKLKEHMTTFMNEKKQLHAKLPSDEKLWGSLTVL